MEARWNIHKKSEEEENSRHSSAFSAWKLAKIDETYVGNLLTDFDSVIHTIKVCGGMISKMRNFTSSESVQIMPLCEHGAEDCGEEGNWR
ncbi:hypothetical protein R1flu_016369 [Riccia fluitans]|uniref:Uncharacterized protein n=1 Tax=Riccia fluitans TaxID=41844 RepID=A0ABD1YLM9_9MARC